MLATMPTVSVSNARNSDLELIKYFKLVAFDAATGTFQEPVDVRCWMGRSRDSSVVHASVWVHSPGLYTSGRGRAGGGGYDKASAAIADALASAGIKLSGSIDGRGDGAVCEALHAIGSALGYKHLHVVQG
jgi:hypothetical protein